ncbi:uncharacterized protein LOC107369059 [Tetranychus urticae]|uniref:uncharacterized protein LOC107369059 n=1 Tax=Tetranychus urticae TaxID=32264 RepID=UPI00077BC59D|nr:uncharacterized protein LOC107369059 [Tetranychus urticae]
MKVNWIFNVICVSVLILKSLVECSMNFAVQVPPFSFNMPRYRMPPMKMTMVMNHDPDSDHVNLAFPGMTITNSPDNSIIINENSSTDLSGSNRPYHQLRPSPSSPMAYRRKLYRMRGLKYDRNYFAKIGQTVSIPYLLVKPQFTPVKPTIKCPNCYSNSQKIAHHHRHFHEKSRNLNKLKSGQTFSPNMNLRTPPKSFNGVSTIQINHS